MRMDMHGCAWIWKASQPFLVAMHGAVGVFAEALHWELVLQLANGNRESVLKFEMLARGP